MLRDLRQICERPGGAEAEDFRAAARGLLERQFLLLERSRDRDLYRLVANHFDYFTNLFDALGWTLHRDDTFGLIGLLPTEAEGFARLRLVDSLMLLCLRLLYEEGMERFEAREGSVYTASETLLGRYEALLGRKRPLVSEYREVIGRLRRHSLIETGDAAEDGLPALRILPTIRLVTGERVQERLAAFLDTAEEETADTEDDDGTVADENAPGEDGSGG
ncbi:DUF4194 domain-containing protein [Thiocystis violacea]|uniref:DUF4194 domain-containing protein n=1 Tax=Thiocystis violacea TaxID=13725 RepID=UPI0019033ACD|nr:DUF4194 domain-containing protein [Thiocystis violacea]